MADPIKIAAFADMSGTLTAIGLSFSIEAGKGSRFPTTNDGSWNAFIYDDYYRDFATAYQNNAGECVRISARSTDTFTISSRAYLDPASKGAIAFTDTSKRYRVELNVNNDNFSTILAPTTFVKPILSEFSLKNNSAGVTATQTSRGIYLYQPGGISGANMNVLTKAKTGTYSIEIAFQICSPGSSVYQTYGFTWRDASGKLVLMQYVQNDGSMVVQKWSSPTTYVTDYVTPIGGFGVSAVGKIFWMKATMDAVNRTLSYSMDGEHWTQIYTGAFNDYMTPTEAGVAWESTNFGVQAFMHLYHWKEY